MDYQLIVTGLSYKNMDTDAGGSICVNNTKMFDKNTTENDGAVFSMAKHFVHYQKC